MVKKPTLLKKPLFQKRRWSCDFPPRKMPVALKHRAISRQEKMAFSAPVRLSWDSPPPPTECADGRTYGCTDVRMCGCTDGRSRDYYVTTKISRIDRLPYFLSNRAPLAGFARRLRYYSGTVQEIKNERKITKQKYVETVLKVTLKYYLLSSIILLKKQFPHKLASRSNIFKININFLAVTNNVEIILKIFSSDTGKYVMVIFI